MHALTCKVFDLDQQTACLFFRMDFACVIDHNLRMESLRSRIILNPLSQVHESD